MVSNKDQASEDECHSVHTLRRSLTIVVLQGNVSFDHVFVCVILSSLLSLWSVVFLRVIPSAVLEIVCWPSLILFFYSTLQHSMTHGWLSSPDSISMCYSVLSFFRTSGKHMINFQIQEISACKSDHSLLLQEYPSHCLQPSTRSRLSITHVSVCRSHLGQHCILVIYGFDWTTPLSSSLLFYR